MESQPGYYSITPAEVRYSKKLVPNAKLLYGEITALCNKDGFCWATNQYFAELYKVDGGTISRWVSQLVSAGFVRVEIIDSFKRKIYLNGDLMPQGVRQKRLGGTSKLPRGVRQKSLHNNKVNTTTKDIIQAAPEAPFSLLEELKKLEEGERRDMNIIALFLEERILPLKSKILNKAQMSQFIKRHLVAAGKLKIYTDNQIIEALEKVKMKYRDIDWTLDTVFKELTK